MSITPVAERLAVTTYYYTLGLSSPGIASRSRAFKANPALIEPARRFYFLLNSPIYTRRSQPYKNMNIKCSVKIITKNTLKKTPKY